MQMRVFEIEEFLLNYKLSPKAVLVDTRSTSEFLKASIPGAVSLPLLDNESRSIIGTIYKKEGREAAVLKGFELEGPRFHEKIRRALDLAPQMEVFIYCWRGGMRSNIMAWLLQMVGFKVTLLKGGYKTFRHWVLKQFEIERKIIVLGGKTGSGKTYTMAGV
jgi:tRNA 2-selenouridine synthase